MANKAITFTEASELITGYLTETGVDPELLPFKVAALSGLTLHFGTPGYIGREKYGVTAVWACDARVTINPRLSSYGPEAEVSRWDISLGWSSTGRSLANAMTAVAAYQRAIDFAAGLTAFLEALPLIVADPAPPTKTEEYPCCNHGPASHTDKGCNLCRCKQPDGLPKTRQVPA